MKVNDKRYTVTLDEWRILDKHELAFHKRIPISPHSPTWTCRKYIELVKTRTNHASITMNIAMGITEIEEQIKPEQVIYFPHRIPMAV